MLRTTLSGMHEEPNEDVVLVSHGDAEDLAAAARRAERDR